MKANSVYSIISILALSGCSIGNISNTHIADNPPQPKQLQINRFVGFVETIPANSSKIEVAILNNSKIVPKIINNGDDVLIEGALKSGTNYSCDNKNGHLIIKFNGNEYSEADLPHLRISLPKDKSVGTWSSSLFGNIGDIKDGEISQLGCGDLSIGNVSNNLELNIAGSGKVNVGDIGGTSEINIGGSGNSLLGSLNGSSEINIGGSGSVQVKNQSARLEANIAGSGNVNVDNGGGDLNANIVGSGSVNHNGYVNNPDVSIVGSGSVNVHDVHGKANVSKIGSGRFNVK